MTIHRTKLGPRRRGGITLIEVLISIGILALGLLGVAALFPVGSFLMQRGEIYDRADAAAQAAFNDAVTRGLLDPQRWVAFNAAGISTPSSFTRNFSESLRQGVRERELAIGPAGGRVEEATQGKLLNQNVGFAYVIDPYAVAAAEGPSYSSLPVNGAAAPVGTVAPRMRAVPAALNPRQAFQVTGDPTSVTPGWYPWAPIASMGDSSFPWPVRRLSVARGYADGSTVPVRMDEPMADTLMSLTDDLAFERPDAGDQPAQQLMATTGGDGLTRLSRRNFSYFLTVVPRNLAARDALAYGGAGQQYDVSAVVFHRRATGGEFNGSGAMFDPDFNGHEGATLNERLAQARILNSAPSGGVLRLSPSPQAVSMPTRVETFAAAQRESRFENLKTGEYMMLLGPHPSSTSARPILVLQWYRVLSVDPVKDASGAVQVNPMTGEALQVDVAVRGPDWPWATPDPDNSSAIANDLRAVIMPGAAAVHTRTMRLDAGVTWAAE